TLSTEVRDAAWIIVAAAFGAEEVLGARRQGLSLRCLDLGLLGLFRGLGGVCLGLGVSLLLCRLLGLVGDLLSLVLCRLVDGRREVRHGVFDFADQLGCGLVGVVELLEFLLLGIVGLLDAVTRGGGAVDNVLLFLHCAIGGIDLRLEGVD